MSGRGRALILTASLVAVAPAFAFAQPPASPPRAASVHTIDFAFGVQFEGPTDFGRADANLLRPDGSPLVLFSTENRLSPGVGLEAHLSYGVARRLSAEVTGAWGRFQPRSRTSSDFENADSLTLTEDMSRFSVEGSGLWTLWSKARTALFVRGGAGWMRELAGQSTLMEDGVIGNAGAGIKYSWKNGSPSGLSRFGLRAEGRAVIRSGGITLGEQKTRVTPAASAGVFFGF